MKLNVSAFALTFGIWWGVGMFLATWWLIGVGGVIDEPTMMERVYVGYHITPVGSLVGLAWGSVCGAICGGIFAWLYNFLAERIGAGAEHLVKKST